MDGESGTPSPVKMKKGRKGRPPKVKSTELISPGEQQQSVAQTLSNSSTYPQGGDDEFGHQNFESNSKECSDKHDTNNISKNSSSDTMLMPPPPALTSTGEIEKDKQSVEATKENELIIDGFSICFYDCEETVEKALKTTGRAYENLRLNIDPHAIAATKSPRIPIRDRTENRSPTGRGRGRGGGRGRPGRPSKRSLESSPLVRQNQSCPNLSSMNSPAQEQQLSLTPTSVTNIPSTAQEFTTATTTTTTSAPSTTQACTTTTTNSTTSEPCTISAIITANAITKKENTIKLTPIAPKQEVIVKTISDLVISNPKAENQTPPVPTKKKPRKSYTKREKGESKKSPVSDKAGKKTSKSESKLIKSETKLKPDSKAKLKAKLKTELKEEVKIKNHQSPISSSVYTSDEPSSTSSTLEPQESPKLAPLKLQINSDTSVPSIPRKYKDPIPLLTEPITPPGRDAVTCTGSEDLACVQPTPPPITTVAAAAVTAADLCSTSTLTTTSVTSLLTTSRSNSVPSVSSSNSRQPTPVCTTNTTPSSRDNNSIRTASRNSSDRNASRSSQPPATSTTEAFNPFSPGQFPLNPAMLSFGAPNGLTAPFNFPGAPSGMGQSAAGFPFGASADHFSHAATLAAANQEAMRAELSRRMLMEANERSMPPFLRPEMMFPPAAAAAASMAGNNPLNPNMPGSAMLLQQMKPEMFKPPPSSRDHITHKQFEKMPKMDPLQMMLAQRNAAAAAVTSVASGGVTNPLIGASPFQAIPSNQSSSDSTDGNKKKSGKWCAAHVRIAWQIYNARQAQKSSSEEINKSASPSNGGKEKKPSGSNLTTCQPSTSLSHSISAITSSVHKPKEVSSTVTHPRPTPKPNAPSPSTVSRLSVESRKSASSSPSVNPDQLQRSSSATSHPGSPASFHSNHSQQSSSGNKDTSTSFSRSWPAGNLPSQSPKDGTTPRWPAGCNKSQLNPSLSSTNSNPSSPLHRKRDRDERDRRSNGSYSSPNSQQSRPSPSSHIPNKKRRSRSRSPNHSSTAKSPHPTNNVHLNNMDAAAKFNNKSLDTMRMLQANSLAASASASNTDLHQLFGSMYGQNKMMGDNKSSLPATNGYGAGAAAAPWNPFTMHPNAADLAQHQQHERERMLMMNPLAALAMAEQQHKFSVQMLELERVKQAAGALHSTTLANLNGFNHQNPLTSISSLGAGPPPLIPTSQAKLSLPLPGHLTGAPGSSSSATGSNTSR